MNSTRLSKELTWTENSRFSLTMIMTVMVLLVMPDTRVMAQQEAAIQDTAAVTIVVQMFEDARAAGKKDAKASPGWFLAGAAGTFFGVGAAYTIPAGNAPPESLLHKTDAWRTVYNESYQREVRSKRTRRAWIGLGAMMAVFTGGFGLIAH